MNELSRVPPGPVRRVRVPAIALMTSLLLAFLPAGAQAEEGCRTMALEEIDAAMPEMSSRQSQLEVAAIGLAAACEFPTSLKEGLEASASAMPEHRDILVMKSVSENPFLWSGICEKPIDMFVEMSKVAPADKRDVIEGACDLDGIGSLSDVQDDVSIGQIAIALAVYNWMDGEAVDGARKYARWMLGLDLPEPQESTAPLFIEPPPVY